MSLRTRVALACAAGALVVLALAGAVLTVALTRTQYADVDRQVTAVSRVVTPVLARQAAARPTTQALTTRERVAAQVADATGTTYVAAAVRGGQTVATAGTTDALPAADVMGRPRGFSTVRGPDGARWRVRTEPAGARGRVVVAVALPLDPARERVSHVRRVVVVVGLGGVLVAAALGWLLAGAAVRPLRRLRERARVVAGEPDADRPPWVRGTAEIDEVADALDAMHAEAAAGRARERSALEAARGFAAGAGHELRTPLTALATDLSVLEAHPDLPPAERAEVVDSLQRAEQRLRSTLQALEQLARGDLVEPGAMGEVDVAELVLQAADDARRHHGTPVAVDLPDDVPPVRGWAPGLRLALDNLLANAARHAGGRLVAVAVRTQPGSLHLVVDDGGPGVPEAERAAVLGRFARGSTAVGAGSGLGLALVDQQARLHGGALQLATSPAGGLRVVLTLPTP